MPDSEPDPDNRPLFADEFTAADQPQLAGLHCGDEPWAKAATEWINSSEVLDSIEKHGTKVWIYRNSEEEDLFQEVCSMKPSFGWTLLSRDSRAQHSCICLFHPHGFAPIGGYEITALVAMRRGKESADGRGRPSYGHEQMGENRGVASPNPIRDSLESDNLYFQFSPTCSVFGP